MTDYNAVEVRGKMKHLNTWTTLIALKIAITKRIMPEPSSKSGKNLPGENTFSQG